MKISIGNFTGFKNEDFRWDEAPCVDDFVERANEILAKALEEAPEILVGPEDVCCPDFVPSTCRIVCIEEIGK